MDRVGMMHFGEFNPLDVLAAAASLQSAQLPDADPARNDGTNNGGEVASDDDDTSDGNHVRSNTADVVSSDVTASSNASVTVDDNDVTNNNEYAINAKLHIVSVLSDNESGMGRKQSAPRVVHVVGGYGDAGCRLTVSSDVNSSIKVQVDDARGTVKTAHLKAVVLQGNTGRFARMITDHSYAFLHRKCGRMKTDDDEGYCSRSSLDSPGQGSRSDSDAWDQDVFEQRDGDNRDSSYRVLSRQSSKRDTAPVVLLSPVPCDLGPCPDSSLSTCTPVVDLSNGCSVVPVFADSSCDDVSPVLERTTVFNDGLIENEEVCMIGSTCRDLVDSVKPTEDMSGCMKDTDTNAGTEQTPPETNTGDDEIHCLKIPTALETSLVVVNTVMTVTTGDQFEPALVLGDVIDAPKTDCQVLFDRKLHGCVGPNGQAEHDCISLENSVSSELHVDVQHISVVESIDCLGDKNTEFVEASGYIEPDIAISSDDVSLSPSKEFHTGGRGMVTRLNSRNVTDMDNGDTTCPVAEQTDCGVGQSSVSGLSPPKLQPSVGKAIGKNETFVEVDTSYNRVIVNFERPAIIPGNDCTVEPSHCDGVNDGSQEIEELETGAKGEDTLMMASTKECIDSLPVTSSRLPETEYGDDNTVSLAGGPGMLMETGASEDNLSLMENYMQSGCEGVQTVTEKGTEWRCGNTEAMTEVATELGCERSQAVTDKYTESGCGHIWTVTDSGNEDVLVPFNDVVCNDISGVKDTEPVILSEPVIVNARQTRSGSWTTGCGQTVVPLAILPTSMLPRVHKSGHQYIIEDDVSPVTKFGLSNSKGSVRSNDAWKLLGTYDQKGVLVSNSHSVATECTIIDVGSVKPHPGALPVVQSTCSNGDGIDICDEADLITNASCVDDERATPATLGSLHDVQTDTPDAVVVPVVPANQTKLDSLVLQLQTKCNVERLQPGLGLVDTVNRKLSGDDIDADTDRTSECVTATRPQSSDVSGSTLSSVDSCSVGHVLGLCSPHRMNYSNDREVATLTLADGRITPVHQNASLGLRGLEMSPCEQINIKIAGGKVVGMNVLDDGRKTTTSIGTVGSLQWTSLPQLVGTKRGRPATKSPYSVNSGSFIPIPDNQPSVCTTLAQPTQLDLYEGRPLTTRVMLDSTCKSSPSQCKTLLSAQTSHMYTRKKLRQHSETHEVDLARVKQSAETILRLHPLIDHDYCMFTAFSAEIQSSIIATTESKLKTDKKYTKKTKSARTTKSEPFVVPTPVETVPVIKLKKRKYVRRKGIVDIENSVTEDEKLKRLELLQSRESVSDDELATVRVFDTKRQEKKLSKMLLKTRRRSDRNYVKITGSYQDEFVYFATKKKRGRPRKTVDSSDPSLIKPASVSGVSIFDWYRDLSKTDKSSRFGSDMTVGSRVAVPSSEPSCSSAARTPIHESEVADLVMDLMPSAALGSNKLFQPYVSSSGEAPKDDLEGSTTSLPVSSKTAQPGEDEQVELNMMAEQVRMMLNSMGEAELNMWGEKLSDSNGDKTSMLAGFPDVSQGETPMAASSNLLDLDDINDNDLLSADMGNMTVILGDLATPKPVSVEGLTLASGSVPTDLPSAKSNVSSAGYNFDKNNATLNMLFNDSASSNNDGADLEVTKTQTEYSAAAIYGADTVPPVAAGLNGLFGETKLDRYELFPDIATPDVSQSVMLASQSSAPELTVVSMFWNDLPGLTIRDSKYVRLVDIHKQILPAKDTGILKKRCQMMGLEVANCSDLERDFLIRYANAVKSKSTVIVPQDAAQLLIGFYVNPRPRASRSSVTDDHASEQSDKHHKSESETTPDQLKPDPNSSSELVDARSETTHEKSSVSQLVDTNGRIRQMIIGRRKHGRSAARCKRRTPSDSPLDKKPKRRRIGVTDKAVTAANIPGVSVVKRSTRMKYQKGHYVAMLQGFCSKDSVNVESAIEKPAASETRIAEDNEKTAVLLKSCHKARWSPKFRVSAGKKVVEERAVHEQLRKMRSLQKKRRLTGVEKLRMKKLRERLREKMIVEEPRRRGRKKKLVAGAVAGKQKLAAGTGVVVAGKRRDRLGRKKLNGAGVEHCYAAVKTKERVGLQGDGVGLSGDRETPEHMTLSGDVVKLSGDVVSSSGDVVAELPQTTVDESNALHESLQIVCCHPDGDDDAESCSGSLRMPLYLTRQSACIECEACGMFFSVAEFLRHQHPSEVTELSQSRTLRMRSDVPLPWETALWTEFEHKRQSFGGIAIGDHVESASSERRDTKTLAKPLPECETHTTRHSMRVRKRKQLHPIERYVFSKLYAVNGEEGEGEDVVDDDSSPEMARLLPADAQLDAEAGVTLDVSGRTKPKLAQRKDSKTPVVKQKYGLRACSPDEPRKRRRL